ncbi:MAG: hypothetical protein GWO23_18660, partial [Gammaproteobacteria bacterium]|nr:hypothetical protein [Gammaproteobacteria bacterium]
FTKATDGKNDLVFKSVLGEATDIQFREEMIVADQEEGKHLQIEVDDKAYFVGE